MNYYLQLLKKKPFTYVLVVTHRNNKKVLEKIGSFNLKNKNFCLKVFRLIYWAQKNLSLSGSAYQLLLTFLIIIN